MPPITCKSKNRSYRVLDLSARGSSTLEELARHRGEIWSSRWSVYKCEFSMLYAPIPFQRMFWGARGDGLWTNSQLLKTLPLFCGPYKPLLFPSSRLLFFCYIVFLLSGFSSRIVTRVAEKSVFSQEATGGNARRPHHQQLCDRRWVTLQPGTLSSSAERGASPDGL